MTKRVAILQEYVPAYRKPLFEKLREAARTRDIEVHVAAGKPNKRQAARADSSDFVLDVELRQREFRVADRRVVLRKTRYLYRSYDLVVVEQARRNLDVYWGLWSFADRVALWGHGRDFTQHSGVFSQFVQSELTRRAHWFFGYTPESVAAVEDMGFPAARTTVLWNTVDTSQLRDDLSTVTAADRSRYREGFHHVGLFVGALDRSKNIDVLIAAGRAISSTLDGFTLVVVGDGPEADRLRRASASHPWLRLAGDLRGRELAIALASSDIMMMPGRIGLVSVDCLTAGLPVVTTDWPLHAPERAYLDGGTSVVAGSTPNEYAVACTDLFVDRARLEQMRLSALRASEPFSIDAMADRFADGLERALRDAR